MSKNRAKQQRIFSFLLILAAGICFAITCYFSIRSEPDMGMPVVSAPDYTGKYKTIAEALIQAGPQNKDIYELLKNLEAYPDELLELAVANPEAAGFVKNYTPDREHQMGDISLPTPNDGKFPHYLQWDERWGYRPYGGKMMALTGCGPTCLSMVATYLTHDAAYHPYAVAEFSERNGYYAQGVGTKWALMSEGARKLGLTSKELPLDQSAIERELRAGRPIIVSVREGDFTTDGHFIVLTGMSNKNMINVLDPNSVTKSRAWEFDVLKPQISNLWSYQIS